MNTGIIPFIKGLAPMAIFAVWVVLALRALFGKTKWPLLFLIMLMPLRNVVDKMQTFPLGKDFVDILLIALIIGWILGSIFRREKIFERSPINGMIVVLILYTFFSVLYGSEYLKIYPLFSIGDPRIQVWKNYCIPLILFFLTFNTMKDKRWVWRTVGAMCLAMVFMDFYLMRQISFFTNIVSRDKIHGTFVYLGPNEVAAFYNQYTILLMGLYFFMRRSLKKSMLLGLITINIFCILFLFSRAAYAGMAVGLFFLFAVKNKKLVIPLVLIAVFWQTALPMKVKQRIEMTTDEYGELDTSSENRLMVWKQSLDLFQENPLIGVGFAGFAYMGLGLRETHNIYLKTLAEQGIVGIFIFLILLMILFFQGLKLYQKGDDPLSKGLGLGFSICIIVLMVNNVFGDRWTYIQLSSYLWVFAGLVARLNVISANANQKPLSPKINTVKKYPLTG